VRRRGTLFLGSGIARIALRGIVVIETGFGSLRRAALIPIARGTGVSRLSQVTRRSIPRRTGISRVSCTTIVFVGRGGWLLESRSEGLSATELVERPLYWNAPLFGEPRPFPNVAYRRQP
jgi:hypothetical protein